ncbi:MAG: hut operon positive regulator HutP [Clostridiales bacterium]|nr:hut operon positive regulator HutP [Clostridiales bacterium]
MKDVVGDSRTVARAALSLAMTADREEEGAVKRTLLEKGIRGAASDYGGDFVSSVIRMIERAVVAAKREGVICDCHQEEGAVAGAARDAVAQIMQKALGLSVGGKIGVARSGEHVAVAVFFTVGLVHLNEVCVGLGHRAVSHTE